MAKGVEARIDYKSEGADKAKADAKEVKQSVKALSGQTAEAKVPVEDLTEAQVKLNASEGDFIGILALASPVLGRVVDGLIKGTKIASQFASKQLTVAQAAKTAASAVRSLAGAMKLLFVGGIVIAAIARLVSVMRELRAEAEGAAKAIRDQAQALDDLQKKNEEIAEESVAQTEEESRGLIIPTFKTKRRAEQLAGRAPERFKQQVADVVNVLGEEGDRFTLRQILDAIQSGFKPDRTLSEEQNRIILEVTNTRKENIEATKKRAERQRQQKEFDRKEALQQAREGVSEGSEKIGQTRNIEKFIGSLPGVFGKLDADKTKELAQIVKAVLEVQREQAAEGPGILLPQDAVTAAAETFKHPGSNFQVHRDFERTRRTAIQIGKDRFGGIKDVTTGDVTDAQTIIRLLRQKPRSNINIAHVNAQGARELLRLSTNGENSARNREP